MRFVSRVEFLSFLWVAGVKIDGRRSGIESNKTDQDNRID
jgi:hypothetical protein